MDGSYRTVVVLDRRLTGVQQRLAALGRQFLEIQGPPSYIKLECSYIKSGRPSVIPSSGNGGQAAVEGVEHRPSCGEHRVSLTHQSRTDVTLAVVGLLHLDQRHRHSVHRRGADCHEFELRLTDEDRKRVV